MTDNFPIFPDLRPCPGSGIIPPTRRLWVEKILLPELDTGDIVILDNLSSHKTAAAREMIETAGCQLLVLPPYSPDCNPIENMWFKIKECLRTFAAREMETLSKQWQRLFRR